MADFWMLMWKPLCACLILAGIHAYLGIHVVERKVIFVDLALAQVAALGACAAIVFGHDVHGFFAYCFSLGAAVIGAVLFSMTRTREEKIPHEAMIGIVYAVSAASAILLLSRSAEGDEHIREMLVGNILLVDIQEILKMLILYGLIGAAHWFLRKKFILISTDPGKAYQQGVRVRIWDFIFYVLFAIVVTTSVEIAGVLLVFAFLIIPSVAAMTVTTSFRHRLSFGWCFAGVAAFTGILISYWLNWPTGATIVCVFGGFLTIVAFKARFF